MLAAYIMHVARSRPPQLDYERLWYLSYQVQYPSKLEKKSGNHVRSRVDHSKQYQ
jgi:hypothetical protein